MDSSGKTDDLGSEKGYEAPINYHSSETPADWQCGVNLSNPMSVSEENAIDSSLSSVPMVGKFCRSIWDQHTSSQHLGFSSIEIENRPSTSNTLGFDTCSMGLSSTGIGTRFEMDWTSHSMQRGGIFFPNTAAFSHSLSYHPVDSGFVERAARFSCFNGGYFGTATNHIGVSGSLVSHTGGVAPILGQLEVSRDHSLNALSSGISQRNKVAGDSLAFWQGTREGILLKNDSKSQNLEGPQLEAKECHGVPGNESGEDKYSGQEKPSMLEGLCGDSSSAGGLGTKKRKQNVQHDSEFDLKDQDQRTHLQHSKADDELPPRNLGSAANELSGKQVKSPSVSSDPPKQEYIHIRARRGQATNSHSLAERIRREKISERMKFLQDLVPGCSKVTGKAVMLDEIINYVQSLQRQVEFLSMKLATVNPRLNFNIEGLLAKELFQSQAGPSSLVNFPPETAMPFASLHSPPLAHTQPGLAGSVNSTDALQKSIISGGYKEPPPMTTMWEDELHNVIQMGFNYISPLNNQDFNGSLSPGHMKAER